jgi:hypothetical protein
MANADGSHFQGVKATRLKTFISEIIQKKNLQRAIERMETRRLRESTGKLPEEEPELIPDVRALISFDPDFGVGNFFPAVDTLWFSSSMEIEVLFKRISES